MSLVDIDTFSVGMEEKLRPRTFIQAKFSIRGVSTSVLANLIVVVNHTRSGSGEMKIKSKNGTKFKQDGFTPVDDFYEI